jgi:hypothetical protein
MVREMIEQLIMPTLEEQMTLNARQGMFYANFTEWDFDEQARAILTDATALQLLHKILAKQELLLTVTNGIDGRPIYNISWGTLQEAQHWLWMGYQAQPTQMPISLQPSFLPSAQPLSTLGPTAPGGIVYVGPL